MTEHPPFQKADVLYRFIAKFIDLLIVAALHELLAGVGFFAGMLYLLIADGFLQGRSVGKWVIGLQTVLSGDRSAASYRESILRNIPLAVAYVLFFIPVLGWILGAAILAVECLLIIGNELGLRLGDELAGTFVRQMEPLRAESGKRGEKSSSLDS